MGKYKLKVTSRPLQAGWSVKIVVEFEPITGCGEESFWVFVESIDDTGGRIKYLGRVEDYLTYTHSHGLMMDFHIEFGPEHVSEIRG